mgnify:FL=1
MKVVIIDDEQVSIDLLTSHLKQYADVEIAGTANNGETGISMIRAMQPELLFLDVELPDMSGLDFLEHVDTIAEQKCKVVIYTAHSAYMLTAFRNKAFDFLLKPVDPSELAKVMSRYCSETDQTTSADGDVYRQNGLGRLLFNTSTAEYRVVNVSDIGLFQYNSIQRVWEVVAAGLQEPLRLKRSANNVSLLAIDPRFVQVSQRYIININCLMEVSDGTCRLFPPFDGIEYVKVGRTFKKHLMDCFSKI